MTHGEIWLIDFGEPLGSLPSKLRPAVIMQNDLLGIKDLNTAVVIPFTSNLDRANFEPNILFKKEETEQIDKNRCYIYPNKCIGFTNNENNKVNKA